MNIQKTFILTNIHTIIKIASSIIMNKIISVLAGPAGIALIAQFQNFSSVATSIGNGSIQTGIIKKISENEDINFRKRVVFNSLYLSIICSALVGVLTFIFSSQIAELILLDSKLSFIIKFFSFNIIFYSLNLFLISVLNGYRQIKLYTFVNILLSIFSLITVSVCTIFFSTTGAIFGLIITQFCVFILSYVLLYKRIFKIIFSIKNNLLDTIIIKDLLRYGMHTLLSGILFSMMMLIVRMQIINNLDLNYAGIWEAAMKIGIYFNMIFILPISVQYLPLFSSAKKGKDFLKYLKQIFSFLFPIMVFSALFIFSIRELIIISLFNKEFIIATNFVIFILIAEILRVFGMVFANLLIGKKKLINNILNELLMAITFVVFTLKYFSNDLNMVIYAYVFASFVYFLINIFSFYRLYMSYK